MIFATVGTSLPCDVLIKKLDSLVEEGKIRDEVIAQIGEGNYIPQYIEYFRFKKSLEDVYDKAEIIISNCGAGTILENVTEGRKLIAVQNPDITGGHEWELLTKMEKGGHLIWCRNLEQLELCIEKAKSKDFATFIPEVLDAKKLMKKIAAIS